MSMTTIKGPDGSVTCGRFTLPFCKKKRAWVLPEVYPGQPIGQRLIKEQHEACEVARKGEACFRRHDHQ